MPSWRLQIVLRWVPLTVTVRTEGRWSRQGLLARHEGPGVSVPLDPVPLRSGLRGSSLSGTQPKRGPCGYAAWEHAAQAGTLRFEARSCWRHGGSAWEGNAVTLFDQHPSPPHLAQRRLRTPRVSRHEACGGREVQRREGCGGERGGGLSQEPTELFTLQSYKEHRAVPIGVWHVYATHIRFHINTIQRRMESSASVKASAFEPSWANGSIRSSSGWGQFERGHWRSLVEEP